MIIKVLGVEPSIHDSCWVAPNATITGKVHIGADSNVWYQAVIRGDANTIYIGEGVNIQDGAIVHGSYEKDDTHIGDFVTIGHRAIIHGCTIKNHVLIGMGAIILDDAIIPPYCIVGAGALVTQGKVLESGWIYGGVPAKKIKKLSEKELEMMTQASADGYIKLSKIYAALDD